MNEPIHRPTDERCLNWPCAKPRNHVGPCSTTDEAPSAEKKLTIETGGLADPIVKQLRAQDIHIPGHATASLERTRRAIVQLRAAGIITRAQRDRADAKFIKLVVDVIRQHKGKRYVR